MPGALIRRNTVSPVKADLRLVRAGLESDRADWRPERTEVCKGRVAA